MLRRHQTYFRSAGSKRKILGILFNQQSGVRIEPGRLHGERERYLCAMPSPSKLISVSAVS